jgi:hypothetical protein
LRVSAALVVALISILAGALILASPISNTNLFHVPTRFGDRVLEAEAATLPLNVDEKFKSKEMAGDSSTLKVIDEFIDPEHHCEFCTRVEYIPGSQGLAGFAYEAKSGLDFSGAKKVRLWVMGQDGGEKIKFDIAGKDPDTVQDKTAGKFVNGIFKNVKFALSTQELQLDKDWKKYEVDLAGADLKDVTHPFGVEISKGSTAKKQVIYIKGITYDTEPPQNPVAVVQTDTTEPVAAQIIPNATQGTAPFTIEFKANVSGGTGPYNVIWDFGDNAEENNEQSVVHTFEKAGRYSVSLAVTDSGSQNASSSTTIRVGEPEKQNMSGNASEAQVTQNTSSTTTQVPGD